MHEKPPMHEKPQIACTVPKYVSTYDFILLRVPLSTRKHKHLYMLILDTVDYLDSANRIHTILPRPGTIFFSRECFPQHVHTHVHQKFTNLYQFAKVLFFSSISSKKHCPFRICKSFPKSFTIILFLIHMELFSSTFTKSRALLDLQLLCLSINSHSFLSTVGIALLNIRVAISLLRLQPFCIHIHQNVFHSTAETLRLNIYITTIRTRLEITFPQNSQRHFPYVPLPWFPQHPHVYCTNTLQSCWKAQEQSHSYFPCRVCYYRCVES